MKKRTLVFLSISLLLGLVGCGTDSSSATRESTKPKEISTEENNSSDSLNESNDFANDKTDIEKMNLALDELKTGQITTISGSDFVVGKDIEAGWYILKPLGSEDIQFEIYSEEDESELYDLGSLMNELKFFKLADGERIELTTNSQQLEAELLTDNLSDLAKGETGYISGSDAIVGEDIPEGSYSIYPILDEADPFWEYSTKNVQFTIYDKNGEDEELYSLEKSEELSSFKLTKGERIRLTTKSNILQLTRTK